MKPVPVDPGRASLANAPLLGSLKHDFRFPTRAWVWVADFQVIPSQSDGTFRFRPRLVREQAALITHDKSLVRLIDRPGAKRSGGSLHRRDQGVDDAD